MALAKINLGATGLQEHATGAAPETALAPFADQDGPVIVMIHGFKFAPGSAAYCPHEHILSPRPETHCWKAKSWPTELGLTGRDDHLGIAFGWPARGSIWQAYGRAAEAGRALARLIRLLHRLAPQRPVHILAHSLGARVALSALAHLGPGMLDRLVLLAGAEFHASAADMLATPAGRTAEVISITSRENHPYDRLLERALGSAATGRAVGRQAPVAPNWLTLAIDDREVLGALSTLGCDIAPPQRWICHWSSYLRPGVFSLYSALLTDAQTLPLAQLRRVAMAARDDSPHRGWSRLRPSFALPGFGFGRAAG
ncbi:alpha/beta hydrolase [Pseudooceanicola sp.]|uniref:alpha/beta hydrolase n=1 Tax=Pseudooceanicola sp. TaxID=1914328 RepID=UPI0035C7858C